jgi:hypothetical protein
MYYISWLYLSRFPWRALLLLWQLRIFAAAAARPDPTPPPFFGGGKYQKNKIACSVGGGCCTCWRVRGLVGRVGGGELKCIEMSIIQY